MPNMPPIPEGELGLREQFESDPSLAKGRACRVWRWLQGFSEADREFLLEFLETPGRPTDEIIRWVRRRDITPPAVWNMNDHRLRRCTCPADHRGRRYT